MNRDGSKKYKLISKKGEGTFSEVVKVQNVENGNYYAMKCMKGVFSSLHQVSFIFHYTTPRTFFSESIAIKPTFFVLGQ